MTATLYGQGTQLPVFIYKHNGITVARVAAENQFTADALIQPALMAYVQNWNDANTKGHGLSVSDITVTKLD